MPFLNVNKPVLAAEFDLLPSEFCQDANDLAISAIKVPSTINGQKYNCWDDFLLGAHYLGSIIIVLTISIMTSILIL